MQANVVRAARSAVLAGTVLVVGAATIAACSATADYGCPSPPGCDGITDAGPEAG